MTGYVLALSFALIYLLDRLWLQRKRRRARAHAEGIEWALRREASRASVLEALREQEVRPSE